MFEESANEITRTGQLNNVWNGEGSKAGQEKRPVFGYFGGVNFDKNGKIVQ